MGISLLKPLLSWRLILALSVFFGNSLLIVDDCNNLSLKAVVPC